MSKLTVPQHITHSTLFRHWLEAINGIIDEELEIYDEIELRAPRNHASETRIYGIGNEETFGHLKLTDTATDDLGVEDGTACTPRAVSGFVADFTDRLDEMEETFTADILDVRTTMQEQIDEINEVLPGKAPIYHASPETTYGKGNLILYGHLRLTTTRSPQYGADSGYAATPSSVQTAYDDAITYVDSFNINERFETVDRSITEINHELEDINDHIDEIDTSIEDIQDLMIGIECFFFEEEAAVDASKKQYGSYIFRNASADGQMKLGSCIQNIKISVSNESDKILTIVPDVGSTINMASVPVVLGKGDTASFVQNPPASNGTVNWTLTARETTLATAENSDSSSIVEVNMASEKAMFIEVSGTCALNFTLGTGTSEGRTEYAEKTLFFIANSSNSRISYPEGVIWMNAYEAPDWGKNSGETLVLKAYQFGSRLFLEQKHNSHIVPSLDASLIRA